MNRRGLGVEQTFVYVVAAITFALIMIFGYRTIVGFQHTGQQAQLVQFKNTLENSIKSIYSNYGSVQQENFVVPQGYSQLCLVDMDYQITTEGLQQLCHYDQIACTVWQQAAQARQQGKSGFQSVDENVFLQPASEVPIKVFEFHLENGQGFLCQEIVGSKMSLRLEGKGSYTQIG